MIKLDGRMLGYNMIGQSESTHSSKQSFLIVSVSCVLEQTSFIMFWEEKRKIIILNRQS